MPTFVFENPVAISYGVLLLKIPNLQWFVDSIMNALGEMDIAENWTGEDENQLDYALRLSAKMGATYQLLNFNPFPVGMVMPFGGTIAPAGYLLCDGSSYSTDGYPELFAQIGYYFGGASTSFNVPNLIDRVPVGSGSGYDQGESGGESTVSLTVADIPSHSHSDIGHTHSIPLVAGVPTQEGIGISRNVTIPIVSDSTGVGFANIQNTGGDGAHNNMQPFQALTYIIYAGRDNA